MLTPIAHTYLLRQESLESAAADDFIERVRTQRGYDGVEIWDDETEHRHGADVIPLMQQPYSRGDARPGL